jgi:hypothetical protein
MLLGDLFEVLVPVGTKLDFFCSQFVIIFHDFLNAAFETVLVQLVEFVTGFDDRFVMGGVLDFDFFC